MYTTPLDCKLLYNTNEVEILSPFIYYSPRVQEYITVPPKFLSDGASLPKILWPIFGHPFYRTNIEAAIIHDFLYRHIHYSRYLSDLIFYDCLKYRKKKYKAISMFYGVRVFGSFPYNRNLKVDFL